MGRLIENSKEISIVIPVYNEEAHILESLQTIMTYIDQVTHDYEILVIDDGSTDDTWCKLSIGVESIPNLTAVRLSRNFGKEYALCAGLEKAVGQAVIVMDADLQHPPELIPIMVDIWRREKVGIVECVKRDRGEESRRYRAGAVLFYGLINRLTGYDLKGASDYKLMDHQVVQAWVRMPEKKTFFRGMTAWLGFKRVTLEFDVAPRIEGTSKWSPIKLTKLALNAVISFTSLPLRIVSIIGLFFLVVAIGLGIQTLYHKWVGTAVTGFTTVILLQLIIGSFTLLSLGIIGEYISAIYHEVKGRPRYIIQDTVSSHHISEKYTYTQKLQEYVEV